MEGILRVTPQELVNAANEFDGTGAQIQALTQEMMELVNGMKNIWQGQAATAYSTKFTALQDDMDKMHRMIKEHVSDLTEMANVYTQAEQSNEETSNALASDVIS